MLSLFTCYIHNCCRNDNGMANAVAIALEMETSVSSTWIPLIPNQDTPINLAVLKGISAGQYSKSPQTTAHFNSILPNIATLATQEILGKKPKNPEEDWMQSRSCIIENKDHKQSYASSDKAFSTSNIIPIPNDRGQVLTWCSRLMRQLR